MKKIITLDDLLIAYTIATDKADLLKDENVSTQQYTVIKRNNFKAVMEFDGVIELVFDKMYYEFMSFGSALHEVVKTLTNKGMV